MKFSWFLALRYLKPKRTFLSIITVISVAGVALGVGVLIVVIAVMAGFQKRIKDEWLKVEPPLYLHDGNRSNYGDARPEPEGGVPLWKELLPKVKSFPGVESASPYVHVGGMVQQARPKEHDDTSVPVENLPPEGASTIQGGTPLEDPVVPEPDSEGAKGPAGKPGVHEKSSVPAKAKPSPPASAKKPSPAPAPVEKPSAEQAPPPAVPAASVSPPSDPVATPVDPAAAADPGAKDADDAAPDGEEDDDSLDFSRPMTDILLIGLDTDDAKLIQKHKKRFEELQNLPNPQAQGEFDVGPGCVILSENVIAKVFRRAVDEYPEPGKTYYNIFASHFLKSFARFSQEENAAKKDPEKRKKLDAKGHDFPLPGELLLTGFFSDDKQQSTGQASIGYVSLETAQELAGAGHSVDGIFVDLADPFDAPAIAKKLEESGLLPDGWTTETWVQRHRQQFEAVENEIGMMYIVLGFISLVAAFCIMNTMITMAVQKRREIGMMRALGAKTSHIVSLFMTKGFIVGFFGTGVGYALGRLVVYFRNDLRTWINSHFGHQIFDSGIYGLSEIPAELRPVDQLLICGIAFVLCTLAAVPPALIVGRMEPARALRNDR